MPDSAPTVPRNPLRRLSQRLELWKIRCAVRDGWDDACYRVGRRAWPRIAPLYRPLLTRTTMIAVTGSCGKSTTRAMLETIVGASHSSRIRRGGNFPPDNAHAVCTTPRSQRYAVFEVSVGKHAEKDMVKRSAEIIRPHVVVVTNVRDDHISAFGSREAIAREKGDLVEALDANGIAVLNADDPLVIGMRTRCNGRVLTFGFDPSADVRIDHVHARWPERLSFRVHYRGETQPMRTQLCGEHWASTALAAVAGALAAGMPLADIARRIETVPPFFGRMCPQTRGDGVTFVRDDIKAPLWTVPASLAFLKDADAPRRIAVVGTVSDYVTKFRRVYTDVARDALEAADHVVFIGPHATRVLKARSDPDDERLQAFNTLEGAHAHLASLLRPGDLVLLKGTSIDHLYLLMLDRFPVEQARRPARAADARKRADGREPVPAYAIVGLGNEDARYAHTRHNVGFDCLDRLARRLGAAFESGEHAFVASAQHDGARVHLVKPRAAMNHTGVALVPVLGDLGIEPWQCILVHDDVDHPLGKVRGKMEGGAGGHRGVRSVLEAFEDQRFARVKIGVGKPADGRTLLEHVLRPFERDEVAAATAALDTGVEQALLVLREVAIRDRQLAAAPERTTSLAA